VKSPKKYTNKQNYRSKKDRSYKIIVGVVAAFFLGLGLITFYYYVTLIDIFNLSKFIPKMVPLNQI